MCFVLFFRYSSGVKDEYFLNIRQKYEVLLNPVISIISLSGKSLDRKKNWAFAIRFLMINSLGGIPLSI